MNFQDYKNKAHQTKAARMKGDLVYYLERNISVGMSYVLIKLFPRISPNYVSALNVLLLFAALWLNLAKPLWGVWEITLVQLLVFRLTAIGDKVDGELARYQSRFTQRGIFYDLLFHFFYPFSFMFSVGFSFFLKTNNLALLLLVAFASILMTNYRILGKLRHHVRFKIKLEGHQSDLSDYRTQDVSGRERSRVRFVSYLLFFIYDWVWLLYLLFVLAAMAGWEFTYWIYLIHLVVIVVALFWQIFLVFPSRFLFSRSDLE